MGIAPDRAITFVSAIYTGSISDKEITRVSGILDLLKPGETVMADKGFDIGDMLRDKGISLNLPPFLHYSGQFSAQQIQETKQIAKLRIHVERAIQRIDSVQTTLLNTGINPGYTSGYKVMQQETIIGSL